VLGEEDLAGIRLGDGELRAYRMVVWQEVAGLLAARVLRRLGLALACREAAAPTICTTVRTA
jgi:hypothetical protein